MSSSPPPIALRITVPPSISAKSSSVRFWKKPCVASSVSPTPTDPGRIEASTVSRVSEPPLRYRPSELVSVKFE